jgi:hypothetical protein
MNRFMYINICAITVIGFTYIVLNLFDYIEGVALVIALCIIMYRLRGIFLYKEKQVNKSFSIVLITMFAVLYISSIIFFLLSFELVKFIWIALYLILMYIYYSLIFLDVNKER